MMKFLQSFIFRRLTLWKLVILIPVFYLFLIWWGYQYMERHVQRNKKLGQIFKPHLKENGGIQWYVKKCPNFYYPRRKYGNSNKITEKDEICHLPSSDSVPNIQMENEWDFISVNYPQYVYTVSGWVQVIDVPNYTPKSLHVIIVPHSHQDPGWIESYDSYYSSYTRKTLNNIVTHLSKNPKLKFIWSEMTYLKKWFQEKDTDKAGLLKLIKKGQLEIVTGGWVMTDEAVTHYASMLNQLVDGHLWSKQVLGVLPNVSWSVDPFGHSPTMTYFLSQAGIRSMVIQRTHFGIKRHFARKQYLEFIWRQTWDPKGGSAVLCHMMPFLLYSIPYSCGPDPHVCCQFDFHRGKCFYGTKSLPALTINDKNIKKLAWAFWEQLQKKSELYRSNVLLIPHGDDFRYSSHGEWSAQFDNLDKLMDFINSNEDMNTKIQYGTISDYFSALQKSQRENDFEFPSLSGDFFPYNDRDDQYWTGFFSVRPLLKHMIRVLQAKLRITEILFSLTCSNWKQFKEDKNAYLFCISQMPALLEGRHATNLFHHHDAITGTSKHYVMDDYAQILKTAVDKLDTLLIVLMLRNIEKILSPPKSLDPSQFLMVTKWESATKQPVIQVNKNNGKWIVIVTNPLTAPWKSAVTVRTSSPFVVRNMDDLVPSQINPVLDSFLQPSDKLYDIVFEADLPPLAVKVFHFFEDAKLAKFAHVSVTVDGLMHLESTRQFKPTEIRHEIFHLENEFIRASFSACTGTLQYTLNKAEDEIQQTSIQMVRYGTGSFINPLKDKSGAYIFMPDGPAREMDVRYPLLYVIEGPVMSSVITDLPGVRHTASIYNINGPVGKGVHIDNSVDIRSSDWDNKELVMRIVSDVKSPDTSICVDLNGFQMLKKKWRSKLLIQGNFHPVTTGAFIENDESSRLTLLTSEAHGMASLDEGWLEVILDRRLMQDDWRGLHEGPHDNAISPSKFILIPERKNTPGEMKSQSCFMSPLANILSHHLNNPLQVAFMKKDLPELPKYSANVPHISFLKAPVLCPNELLNLRYEADVFTKTSGAKLTALLMLHRAGVDCNFSDADITCEADELQSLDIFQHSKIELAVQTSITGTEELQNVPSLASKISDMEIKTIRVTFSNSPS